MFYLKQYSKESVLKIFLENKDLYRRKQLNYRGVVKNGTESYTEMLAEAILDKFNALKNNKDEFIQFLIPGDRPIPNDKIENGIISSHKKITYRKGSNRNEENIAKRVLELALNKQLKNEDGYTIKDYQVPVNRVHGSNHGKVDLILKKDNKVFLGELKDEKSKETILRAVMEVKTYLTKIEMNEKALQNFKSYCDEENILIVPAVILCSDENTIDDEETKYNCLFYDFVKMKKDAANGNKSALYQLCKAWNIEFFELSFDNKEYWKDALGNDERDKKGNRIRNYQKDQYTLTHLSY